MRNLVKALALAAVLVPAMAFAAISGTKHDLSFGNNAAGVDIKAAAAANGGDQLCIFCHTPHRATDQNLLWNRAAFTKTFTWGATATTSGTPLSGTIQAKSMACLSCHDGTVALGDVMNSGGQARTGANTIGMVGTRQTGNVMGSAAGVDFRVGTNGDLSNNHPVSIAYPGTANQYNGGASAAAAADYATVATGCATPTGLCTGATGAAAVVTIYSAGAGATLAYGIECGSCHDVHNKYAQASFLRASNAGSALCLACHVK